MTARPTLAALLRDQSRSARARFVAALYAARGAATRIEGSVVVVDGERYLVASQWAGVAGPLASVRPTRRSNVDHVVAIDPTRAARVAARYDAHALSAADLDRLARYGLDRTTADALFDEQFGRPVDAVCAVDARVSRPTRAPATDDATTGRALFRLVVASIVAVALVGIAFSGAGATNGSLPWVWDASESVSVSTPVDPDSPGADSTTESAAVSPNSTAHSWLGPNASLASPAEVFAPGLSTSGVTDVDALAEAHTATLGNRSYRWELAYVESVNGTVTARGIETVRVGSRRSFVSRVDWNGQPVGFTPVASQSSYADGTSRHRPAANGSGVATYSLTDLSPAGEQGWRASRYLRWYLSTTDSSIERTLVHTDQPTAVVHATGTAYPDVDDYTVRAHVTSEGFVQSLSVSYVLSEREDSTPVAVEFTFQYHVDEVGSVSPPTWYTADEARRAG